MTVLVIHIKCSPNFTMNPLTNFSTPFGETFPYFHPVPIEEFLNTFWRNVPLFSPCTHWRISQRLLAKCSPILAMNPLMNFSTPFGEMFPYFRHVPIDEFLNTFWRNAPLFSPCTHRRISQHLLAKCSPIFTIYPLTNFSAPFGKMFPYFRPSTPFGTIFYLLIL